MVVAEVFVFIEEDGTLVLNTSPLLGTEPWAYTRCGNSTTDSCQCRLVIESAPRNSFGEVSQICSVLFTLVS